MRKIINNKNGARRSGFFAIVAISTLGLIATISQSETAYAQTKRSLFASAAQCRKLTENNAAQCCFALNKRAILTKKQLEMCPPLTTAAISTPLSKSTDHEGGRSSRNGGRSNNGSSGGSAAAGNTGGGSATAGNTGGGGATAGNTSAGGGNQGRRPADPWLERGEWRDARPARAPGLRAPRSAVKCTRGRSVFDARGPC